MRKKIAIIVGASRGLGQALCETLCTSYDILAVARTVGALEDLDNHIRSIGGNITLAPIDITDTMAVKQICRSTFDRWGHLDLWVQTAIHAPPLSPADHIDPKDWTDALAINVTAVTTLITHLAPLLHADSQVVFFDDPVAIASKFFGAYGATKAAQISLARSWAAETRKIGPRIHIFAPCPMPTYTRRRFFPGEDSSNLSSPQDEAQRLRTLIHS